MADRSIKLRRLKQILAKFGIECSERRGKGSHCLFTKVIDGRPASYPIPDGKDVLICYIRSCRKKFKLTEEDGVPDSQFYEA